MATSGDITGVERNAALILKCNCACRRHRCRHLEISETSVRS